jgi:lipoprotein NlpD
MKAMSRAIVLAAVLFLSACATRTAVPVQERTPLAPPPSAGAAAERVAPPGVETQVPTYTVKRGDTLYLIALDKGLAYRDLAAWNNIDNPNLIRVGQVLRLIAPGAAPQAMVAGTDGTSGVTTTPLRVPAPITETRSDTPTGAPGAPPPPVSSNGAPAVLAPLPGAPGAAPNASAPRSPDNYKSAPKAVKEPYSPEAARDFPKLLAAAASGSKPGDNLAAAAPAATASGAPRPSTPGKPAPPAVGSDDDRLDWMWPAKGKVVGTFSETANLKGIDISGTTGAPVVASAAGRIVYAGTGLRGYGSLVIIKHNESYLSAYAHNSKIVVAEGDTVARGQKIAEMGSSDADQVKLHFEIRRQGKPMDPLKYLPSTDP